MTMRPVASMPMQDVQPSAIESARPTFIDIDPARLLIDEAYQRDISERGARLIRRIVAGWDWRAFKPPVVVQIGDDFHIIDGQHTAIAAASRADIETIPVMLVDPGTEQSRAGAFVKHNRDRLSVTATQLHCALVQAGDDDALTVQAVCVRAGARVLKNPPSYGKFLPGDTMAVAALRALVSRRYAVGARRVMDVCVAAGLAPITADAIKAVEKLLFDPEYANSVSGEAVADTIRRMASVAEREAAQFAAAHKVPRWKAFVVIWFRNTRKIRIGSAAA